MTRDEIIKEYEAAVAAHAAAAAAGIKGAGKSYELFKAGLDSLRPVSREQVEKMKKAPVKGEYDELYAPTYKCPECGFWDIGRGNFCRNCGCLHTDEAVHMVMGRLEALRDET